MAEVEGGKANVTPPRITGNFNDPSTTLPRETTRAEDMLAIWERLKARAWAALDEPAPMARLRCRLVRKPRDAPTTQVDSLAFVETPAPTPEAPVKAKSKGPCPPSRPPCVITGRVTIHPELSISAEKLIAQRCHVCEGCGDRQRELHCYHRDDAGRQFKAHKGKRRKVRWIAHPEAIVVYCPVCVSRIRRGEILEKK